MKRKLNQKNITWINTKTIKVVNGEVFKVKTAVYSKNK